LLCQVINLIPRFLSRVAENQNSSQMLLQMGRYHLDQEYPLKVMQDLDGMHCFTLRDRSKMCIFNHSFFLIMDLLGSEHIVLVDFQLMTNILDIGRKNNDSNKILITWVDDASKVKDRLIFL
jgi:hypothetical protein